MNRPPAPVGSARTGLVGLVVLAALTTTAGCSWLEDGPVAAPPAREPAPPTLLEDADALAGAVDDALDRRARALRRGDADAVVAQTVAEEEARRAQRRYTVNLSRLPVGVLRYERPPEVTVDDDLVRVRVRQVLQLSRFDAAPVRSEHELVWQPVRGEELRLVSELPVSPDASAGGAQPWDVRPIGTVRDGGVLGVFDVGSIDSGEEVVDATAAAVREVREVVPYRWTRPVVVYAPSDLLLLDSVAGLPGGDPERLDGVAIPIRSDPDGPVISERVVLNPRMLTADETERGRLLRHELTHVALGARDELVPRWLAEGIAEWVSVQPLELGDRLLSSAALTEARRGLTDLPDDGGFNEGPRSSANYDVAWQVCEEIAAVFGPDALWTLLEAMDVRGDAGGGDPDRVLRQVLGTTGPELAAAATDRILRQYG
ncbi:hypothetical protein [uncultured Nocardioides sp.]|uniref:hypothetical protein n=1 Tax=uncultured Nocardioides sp. TaxID=198441 RepID=UPI00261A421A|nr:hypothetical protein [uncultured Nocardioides sp.]